MSFPIYHPHDCVSMDHIPTESETEVRPSCVAGLPHMGRIFFALCGG
jgi:hypothetical protein